MLDAALAKATALHGRAVHENATGHAARAELLIRRGLETIDAVGDHAVVGCRTERCRTVSRLLATLAKSTVEIHGLDPALKSGPLRFDTLRGPTQDAWLRVAAASARGLD